MGDRHEACRPNNSQPPALRAASEVVTPMSERGVDHTHLNISGGKFDQLGTARLPRRAGVIFDVAFSELNVKDGKGRHGSTRGQSRCDG